jgi:hypothetical protein
MMCICVWYATDDYAADGIIVPGVIHLGTIPATAGSCTVFHNSCTRPYKILSVFHDCSSRYCLMCVRSTQHSASEESIIKWSKYTKDINIFTRESIKATNNLDSTCY